MIITDKFPDEQFRNFVIKNYARQNGEVYFQDIEDVRSLWLPSANIKSVEGIQYFPFLRRLSCAHNEITKLHLETNIYLEFLNCMANQIESLDVRCNENLIHLNCAINQLKILDVSRNKLLQMLDCSQNRITSLDLQNNLQLYELTCPENQLTELDVSQNTKLKELNCPKNSLTSLDVSKNTELEIFIHDDNINLNPINKQSKGILLGRPCGGKMVENTAEQ